MAQQQRTRRGVVLYEKNPFFSIDMVKTRIKRMTNKKGNMMMVVSGETGEVVANTAGFWWSREVDDAQFVKIYINGVKAFSELTSAGTKVFELLYLAIQKAIGQDRVWLSYTGFEDSDISRRTFARGLAELIEKGFIAPCPAMSWYWINPDYVFNGDRITLVQTYRRKAEKKGKQQVQGQIEMEIPALAGEAEEEKP